MIQQILHPPQKNLLLYSGQIFPPNVDSNDNLSLLSLQSPLYIFSFPGGECLHCGLLFCYIVNCCILLLTFQRIMLFPVVMCNCRSCNLQYSSFNTLILKMEAECSSETPVSTYNTTYCYDKEYHFVFIRHSMTPSLSRRCSVGETADSFVRKCCRLMTAFQVETRS
jgi:hypothetical protein